MPRITSLRGLEVPRFPRGLPYPGDFLAATECKRNDSLTPGDEPLGST